MINIFLIRHGKASSGWNSLDPALDNFGKKQSKELAKKLLNYSLESYDLFSSPLLRCKQTSKPFRLLCNNCLLYTSPSPRDVEESRMPCSA